MELLPFITRVSVEALPTTVQLSLEMYRDPEIDDVYLALLVRAQISGDELLIGISRARSAYTDTLIGKVWLAW